MRSPLVAGNWKLNGTLTSIRALVDTIIAGAGGDALAEMAVCPPFVYLPEVRSRLASTGIALGAQDVSDQASGAFTGEVAAAMLREFDVKYCIVGHSERRHVYGESDALIAQKFAAARRADITPILCVGELLEQREQALTEQVVQRQLDAVLELAGIAAFGRAVIAYEPVWAIGTGKTATPEQAQSVHAGIRAHLAGLDGNIASQVRILYGGSVKADNARELFSQTDIDGALIGGASLNAQEFLKICSAA
ncbi:MAG: triose-phosphate isomerase [Gammaproteobacteria bacterium]|nr:triose-phosphate isomerase [Gammaproteobacteria bacterium]